jgi:hypothetical protein
VGEFRAVSTPAIEVAVGAAGTGANVLLDVGCGIGMDEVGVAIALSSAIGVHQERLIHERCYTHYRTCR